MIAAAAPLAPLAGEAALALTLAAGFVVAFGLLYVYRSTLSRILTWLADELDDVDVNVGFKTLHLFGPLSNLLRTVDDAISDALGYFVQQTERGMVYFWNETTDTFDLLGDFLSDFADTVAATLATLTETTIPNALLGVEARVARRLAAIASSVTYVRSVAIPRVWGEIDDVRGRVGQLGRDIVRAASRLRRLEKLLTAAGAAALVMVALKRLGLGWVRCTNVSKAGKRLCGMDLGTLDALLASTLLLSGAISVERLTRDLLGQADTVEAALRKGFVELRELA